MDKNWRTIADDNNKFAFEGFEKASFADKNWELTDVPHNWDKYEGYRRLRHGNRHGYAWYRRSFRVKKIKPGQRYFLFFEGVGSYATIWLNGKKAGYHAGGRATFTIDVSSLIHLDNSPNLLAVRADHPAYIRDLPWVCGGCSDERGFSEGSQPMGIFRPVHLIITNPVRIEPFGVHVWNDTTVSTKSAKLYLETEIKNYSTASKIITLISRVVNDQGVTIVESKSKKKIDPNRDIIIHQEPPVINYPNLWSPSKPYLYKIVSTITEGEKVIDEVTTVYGIRRISWPVGKASSSNQFLINGKPFFINGVAEYEHLLGKSHAFSAEQIKTRVMEVKAAGFNAFRDAHQPHNLRYQRYWDSMGILWWPQFSAHIWFDSAEFKKNFKKLLEDWVKERRNSPSVVLWGLQNESKLPEDFAKECSALIRRLDPTASSQRLIVTCNGGSGTDWDIPQNWTGTYGGNPETYNKDIKKQILVGEYGAWRTLGLHTEGDFNQDKVTSEDRMTRLLEMKIRLGESAKDSAAGQFMWLLASHENPGRVQSGEGFRELDRIGPVNYKGLFTAWDEPVDAFFMFRSNYAPKEKEPMVYIVSHTWPDRWIKPGIKNNIIVYSNCDEVELFNDVRSQSLGKRKKNGMGSHFQWDSVNIRYNVLYAVGYVNGKEVAKDYMVLNHLPPAPHVNLFLKNVKPVIKAQFGYHYLYRVNCGGGNYKDKYGNLWMADKQKSGNSWGSLSWTHDFPGMPAFYASQREITDPVKGTDAWKLFQTFRYGREKLRYLFPVPDGKYLVELYFMEPWVGRGGGLNCNGWRLFDVAINNKTVLKDLDLWKEAGYNTALKKSIIATVKGGQLTISFPKVASGEAVISAIAIASLDKNIKPAPSSKTLIQNLVISGKVATKSSIEEWADTGDQQFYNLKDEFSYLPPELFGAEWIKYNPADTKPLSPKGGIRRAGIKYNPAHKKDTNYDVQFSLSESADVFVAYQNKDKDSLWLKDFADTKEVIENSSGKVFALFKRRYSKGSAVSLGKPSPGTGLFTVFVVPAGTMEPAYDLKPVVSYSANEAIITGTGIEKGKIDGKDRVIFKKASPTNTLEWNISIGAADIYSLTISYNNSTMKNIKGRLQFFSGDGTLMKEKVLEFTPTKTEKSNYINTTTGSMVNAGSYKLKISSENAEGLSIRALDVQ